MHMMSALHTTYWQCQGQQHATVLSAVVTVYNAVTLKVAYSIAALESSSSLN